MVMLQVREDGQPRLDARDVVGGAGGLVPLRVGHVVADKVVGEELIDDLWITPVVGLLVVAADQRLVLLRARGRAWCAGGGAGLTRAGGLREAGDEHGANDEDGDNRDDQAGHGVLLTQCR